MNYNHTKVINSVNFIEQQEPWHTVEDVLEKGTYSVLSGYNVFNEFTEKELIAITEYLIESALNAHDAEIRRLIKSGDISVLGIIRSQQEIKEKEKRQKEAEARKQNPEKLDFYF